MVSILNCPICKNILNKEANSFKCANEHTFDLSKDGYLNLLLVNQKSSNMPGDSLEMVNSRRTFLEKGFYSNLSTELSNILSGYLITSKNNDFSILDIGCGEGYYLGNICNTLKDKNISVNYYGLDISKFAISLASKKYKEIFFMVSNINYTLPFINNSFDYILNIFAPHNPSEFNRILSPNGKLIIVVPGINHLTQLRQALGYDISYVEKQEDIINSFKDYFKVINTTEVKNTINIDKESAKSLVKMTPIFWKIDQTKLDAIYDMEETIHFNILVLEKI